MAADDGQNGWDSNGCQPYAVGVENSNETLSYLDGLRLADPVTSILRLEISLQKREGNDGKTIQDRGQRRVFSSLVVWIAACMATRRTGGMPKRKQHVEGRYDIRTKKHLTKRDGMMTVPNDSRYDDDHLRQITEH